MGLNLKHISDEELFELMKVSDKRMNLAAFNEIYARYSTKVYTYCKKVLYNNKDAADDVFQETFTRLFEMAQRDKVMSNLAGYIIKIARNLCLSEKAFLLKDNIQLEDLNLPIYDKSYDQKQLFEIIDLAIQSLPDSYREAIIMKEYLNMSYNEIADSLGVTMTVVRVRIYRAKNKIREYVQPYLEDLNKMN